MGLSTIPVSSDDEIDLKEALVEEETRTEFSLDDRYLRVQGDEELLEARDFFEWNGSGTEEDPIIIRDISFRGNSYNPAFRLDNTSLHLILENCTFINGNLRDIEIEEYRYSEWDLFLRNCSNATITRHDQPYFNFLYDQVYFSFLDCEKIRIIDNENGHFTFYGSRDSIIEGNRNIWTVSEDGNGFTIHNNIFTSHGPTLTRSEKLNISGNTFIGEGMEVMMIESCDDISMYNNNFTNYFFYISGEGTFPTKFNIGNNTINGQQIILLQNERFDGAVYTGDLGYIILMNVSGLSIGDHHEPTNLIGLQLSNCREIMVINTSVECGYNSITFSRSKDIDVIGSTLSSRGTVLQIDECEDIEVSNCSIQSTYYSSYARLDSSDHISFIQNNMTGGWPISVSNCNFTLFKNNTLGGYYSGINLVGTCMHNRILDNRISCGFIGIYLDGGSLSSLEIGGGNTIAGLPIMYLKGTFDPGLLPDGDIFQLMIFDLHDQDVSELSKYSFYGGISVHYSSDLIFDSLNISSGFNFMLKNCERIRINNSAIRGDGIKISGGGYSIIENCTFEEGSSGLQVEDAWDITFQNNIISDVHRAIEIEDTTGIRMIGNEMLGDLGFFDFKGCEEIEFIDNTISHTQGGPVFHECIDVVFNGNHLRGKHMRANFMDSQVVRISDNWMQGSSGVYLSRVDDIRIMDNYFSDSEYNSISVGTASNIYVNNNTIENGRYGITLYGCENFTISDNHINDNYRKGISIYRADRGYIIGNEIINNVIGLEAEMVSDVMITGNNFERNEHIGLSLNRGANNFTIWANTFDRNHDSTEHKDVERYQASDYGKNNTWFMEFGGGNMWSDWRGNDKDGDGFVDDMYLINGSAGSYDEKPLVWELEGEEVNGGVLDLSSGTWCFVMIIAFAALVFLIGKILREGSYDQDKKENM